MTFPGGLARGAANGALARAIVTGWLAVAVLLLMLGWATRTLDAFDQRAILAWLVATPFALVGAHRLAPLLLARLLYSERSQRVAVIAGANEVARRLAERIREEPLLGVRIAGFFDDRDAHRTGAMAPYEDLGALSRLADYVKKSRVDLIYIALPMA